MKYNSKRRERERERDDDDYQKQEEGEVIWAMSKSREAFEHLVVTILLVRVCVTGVGAVLSQANKKIHRTDTGAHNVALFMPQIFVQIIRNPRSVNAIRDCTAVSIHRVWRNASASMPR